MEVLCTTCSKRKRRTPGLLPARHRYLSKRIRYVLDLAERSGQPVAILSGRYGMLAPDDRIPWYDQALTSDDADTLVPQLAEQLHSRCASAVLFYARPRSAAGWGPYHEALERACQLLDIGFEVKLLGPSFP